MCEQQITIIAIIINFLVAAGTITVAIMAKRSIDHSKVIQNAAKEERQEDKKQLLLNTVLEWATNLGAYMVGRNLPPFRETLEKQIERDGKIIGKYFLEAISEATRRDYLQYRMRSVYILVISNNIPEIRVLVNEAVEHIRKKIETISNYANKHPGDIKLAGYEIAENEDQLYQAIVKLTEEIGKISFRDISSAS
ncbi:hypothetical protein ACFLU4_04180 [Chloroflexota bacterium]